jgi:hypothetical protein
VGILQSRPVGMVSTAPCGPTSQEFFRCGISTISNFVFACRSWRSILFKSSEFEVMPAMWRAKPLETRHSAPPAKRKRLRIARKRLTLSRNYIIYNSDYGESRCDTLRVTPVAPSPAMVAGIEPGSWSGAPCLMTSARAHRHVCLSWDCYSQHMMSGSSYVRFHTWDYVFKSGESDSKGR